MEKDFHCATAAAAEASIPSQIISSDLADFFKMLGDYTRIRLLFALDSSELCVHDLGLILGMQQSAVSHQLKILRANKVVSYRKDGRNTYYALSDPHISEVLKICHTHLLSCEQKENES